MTVGTFNQLHHVSRETTATCNRCGAHENKKKMPGPKGFYMDPEGWGSVALHGRPMRHAMLCPPCNTAVYDFIFGANP